MYSVPASAWISKKVEGGISIEKWSFFNAYPPLRGGGKQVDLKGGLTQVELL